MLIQCPHFVVPLIDWCTYFSFYSLAQQHFAHTRTDTHLPDMSTITTTQVQTAQSSIPDVSCDVPAGEVPLPFTLQSLRAAIPAECFVKDTWRSIGYFIRDWAIIGALYALYPIITAHNPCQWHTNISCDTHLICDHHRVDVAA